MHFELNSILGMTLSSNTSFGWELEFVVAAINPLYISLTDRSDNLSSSIKSYFHFKKSN